MKPGVTRPLLADQIGAYNCAIRGSDHAAVRLNWKHELPKTGYREWTQR